MIQSTLENCENILPEDIYSSKETWSEGKKMEKTDRIQIRMFTRDIQEMVSKFMDISREYQYLDVVYSVELFLKLLKDENEKKEKGEP